MSGNAVNDGPDDKTNDGPNNLTNDKTVGKLITNELIVNGLIVSELDELRQILKSLQYSVILSEPERFFEYHRHLARNGKMSLGVRFTVQYNLFAGTVMVLGNDKQKDIINNKVIGCFCLTEKLAGVNSGLVVHAEANWNPISETFHLKTRHDSPKYWISQGCTAEYGVVFARVKAFNKDYGIHAFLINMKQYSNSITITDMGSKTVALGLDNAQISFDCVLPASCLLDKYIKVTKTGVVIDNQYNFYILIQRLLTGRYAIATSACEYFELILNRIRDEFGTRKVYINNNKYITLNELPTLKNLLKTCRSQLESITKFNCQVEKQMCYCLRNNKQFPTKLVNDILVSKIVSTELPVRYIPLLRSRLGSQSLMTVNNFGSDMDIFLMCAFAEGSNDLLRQKLARDTILASKFHNLSLIIKLKLSRDPIKVWFDNYQQIMDISDTIIKSKL